MTDIAVQKVKRTDDRSMPVFAEVDRLMRSIQERAFALSEQHAESPHRLLDDWLCAEREFCWPATDFSEYEKEYRFEMALAGYEPNEIAVTVTPREVIVRAKSESRKQAVANEQCLSHWTTYGANDVLRRIEVGADIDVNKVTATLKNGLLRIVAAKAPAAVVKSVPIATAA